MYCTVNKLLDYRVLYFHKTILRFTPFLLPSPHNPVSLWVTSGFSYPPANWIPTPQPSLTSHGRMVFLKPTLTMSHCLTLKTVYNLGLYSTCPALLPQFFHMNPPSNNSAPLKALLAPFQITSCFHTFA